MTDDTTIDRARREYEQYAIGPADALIALLVRKIQDLETENEELRSGLVCGLVKEGGRP